MPPSYLLSYLDTPAPSAATAVGTTTELPPTPRSFVGNDRFMAILNDVLRENAAHDDDLRAQAMAFAAPGGTIFSNTGPSSSRSGGSVLVYSPIAAFCAACLLSFRLFIFTMSCGFVQLSLFLLIDTKTVLAAAASAAGCILAM